MAEKHWRPENWEEIKDKLNYRVEGLYFDPAELGKSYFMQGVEAGADAVLEALYEVMRKSSGLS